MCLFMPSVPDDLEGQLWFMTGAEYIPSQEKIAQEEKVFFVPSSMPGSNRLLLATMFTLISLHKLQPL